MKREELRNEIKDKFGSRRIKMGTRFLLNAAGGIPIIGGAISGTGSAWAEAEQNQVEDLILQWMKANDQDLEFLLSKIDTLIIAAEPNQFSFETWLYDLVGEEMAEIFLNGQTQSLDVMLHPTTAQEMDKYQQAGFIKIDGSSGNQMLMGAGNRIGSFIEEKKRPYGMGNSYSIYLSNR